MGYCAAADLYFFISVQERNATTIKYILGLHEKEKGKHGHYLFSESFKKIKQVLNPFFSLNFEGKNLNASL